MDFSKNKSLLKKIELYLKGRINYFIQNNYSPLLVNVPINIFNSGNLKKILLLRQDRIGDVLISTPFLKNLRKISNGIEIHILLSSKNNSARKAVEPFTDKIYIYNKKPKEILRLISKLRRENYDLIIDLFDNPSSTSNFLLKYIKSKWKLGIDKTNSGNYTHTVPLLDKMKYHIVERVCNLLLPFNIDPKTISKELIYKVNKNDKPATENILGKKVSEYRLGINLSGSTEAKFWGIENNRDFCKRIINDFKNVEIILFTTNAGLTRAEEIQHGLEVQMAPLTNSFHEFAVMVSTCDIILSPDTSVIHLASAFGIPVIGLFEFSGSNFGMPWYPYNVPCEVINDNNSIKNIKPEIVFRRFTKLYEKNFTGSNK